MLLSNKTERANQHPIEHVHWIGVCECVNAKSYAYSSFHKPSRVVELRDSHQLTLSFVTVRCIFSQTSHISQRRSSLRLSSRYQVTSAKTKDFSCKLGHWWKTGWEGLAHLGASVLTDSESRPTGMTCTHVANNPSRETLLKHSPNPRQFASTYEKWGVQCIQR